MSENTVWVQHARRFIATDDEKYLKLANETCTDISLLSFLGRSDVLEGNVSLDAHQSLVERLEAEQRFMEATIVKMLSVRDMVVLADRSVQLAPSEHEFVLGVCSYLAELSNNHNFAECSARFLRAMGMLHAKRRNWEETLRLLRNSLTGYKTLASLEPQVYRPSLATTLVYLGNVLQEMSRFRASRRFYERALKMCRHLAALRPEIYNAYVGSTLNNLGSVLLELNMLASARDTYREACDIYCDLSRSASGIYRPYVGATSNNLGLILLRMRDLSASHEAHTKAKTIFRELAIKEPDVYKVDLAMTLNNLGNTLWHQRKCTAARNAYAEARRIYGELVDSEPETYRPDLAMTLSNLANALRDTHEFVASHKAYIQAEAIYRELSITQPTLYCRYVATTLNNMSILLHDMRNFTASREACDEALLIRCELASSGHGVCQSDVAITLNNLGNVLADLHEYPASRDAYEEAVKLYSELNESDQKKYRPQLATSLTNLGNVLREMKAFDASKNACMRAEKIFRDLVLLQPDANRPGLAGALNNLGNVLQLMDEFVASRDAYEEAEQIYEQLEVLEPKTYAQDIVMTLCNLGTVNERLGEDSVTSQYSHRALIMTETMDVTPELRWLIKGKAFTAYRRRLNLLAETGSADEVFRCLMAMRDGHACALERSEPEPFAESKHYLQSIEASFGHRLCALIAQDIGSHGMMLVLLDGSSKPLRWWRLLGFKNAAEKLFLEVATEYNRNSNLETQKRSDLVANLAEKAWSTLPNEVQQVLLPNSDYQQVLISGDRFWTAFCWEILRYGSREGDMVGRHQVLPRWGGLTAEALMRLKEMSFGNGDELTAAVICPHNLPNYDYLKGALDEALAVEKQLVKLGYKDISEGRPLQGRFAHRMAVRDALLTSPTVLHYTGHGTVFGAEESLLLWAEPSLCERHGDIPALFGRKELLETVAHVRSEESGHHRLLNHSLVVLNSCRTGGTRSYGGQREDLAWAFLEHGAEVVVASPFPVKDAIGRCLGKGLYGFSTTLKDQYFGQTFLAARRLIEKRYRGTSHCSMWSLLAYHGNPYARLPYSGDGNFGDEY